MADPRWVFHHRLTVRFSDCDLLGHVNNAVYFTYFEECRLEWWRTFGDSPMGTPGFGVIIAHCSCNYRAPAFVSDRLEIALSVAAIGTSSLTIDHLVTHVESGKVLADGRTVVVAYDHQAGKSVPIPPATRATLAAFMEPA
jgi:acyl-CoA thioester hydrolase